MAVLTNQEPNQWVLMRRIGKQEIVENGQNGSERSSSKTLVQWLVATLFIALLGGAQGVALCNIDSSQLQLCRAAASGQNPPPPNAQCCAVIRQANLPCLCKYKSVLPIYGINPQKALALPPKCGLQSPKC
ncbi:hypothetical protein VNO78_15731 [Psophocarpus tetragonolobus]|uniref:Bifunctional inhibitor/plant lipid transfer protein/seed storage helical domain-containing protein n=1 Tax=Psophocarpus tetragonolobus TaxID=3891 RepID=A0AAN9SEK9_PSOTE